MPWSDSLKRVFLGGFSSRTLQHVLIVLAAFAGITGILTLNLREQPGLPALSVGEASPQDIVAPRTLEVVDERATKEARENAAASQPTVYVLDPDVRAQAQHNIERTFRGISRLQLQANPSPTRIAETARTFPIQLSPTTLSVLVSSDPRGISVLRTAVVKVVTAVMLQRIPLEKVSEARRQAVMMLREVIPQAKIPRGFLPALKEVTEKAVQPNFVPSYEKTEAARQERMAHVEPVKTLYTRGQIIVRKGDLVTQEQMAVLDQLGFHRPAYNVFGLLGTALFVCLGIFVVGIYLAQQDARLLGEIRLMWLLVLIVIAVLAMTRGGTQWSHYFAPIATASLLIALLLDHRLALLVTALMSLCVGIMTGQFAPCAVSMVTGLVAVLSVTNVSRRSDLLVASLVVCLVNVLSVLVFCLWNGDDLVTLTHNTFAFGSLSGATASVVAMGALPFLETIFSVTTHLKLWELSNPCEPLLQRLMVEAPGTYHHSMIVANLAESAARSINADGLLAKVGAFYHDIGKMKAASFFVENQLGQENPHDRLTPTLSAHIIISHVTDGMELARQSRLPQIIADFIDMHHGDRLVSYFYHKAVQRGEQAMESDYRYHGRRPRTRETAIVMMADTIEAKARLVAKPNQENLEKMVRESIRNIVDDGQLDESELSLRDIQVITRAFVKTLMGIYHSRIEYPKPIGPGQAEGEEKPVAPEPGPGIYEPQT